MVTIRSLNFNLTGQSVWQVMEPCSNLPPCRSALFNGFTSGATRSAGIMEKMEWATLLTLSICWSVYQLDIFCHKSGCIDFTWWLIPMYSTYELVAPHSLHRFKSEACCTVLHRDELTLKKKSDSKQIIVMQWLIKFNFIFVYRNLLIYWIHY